jgi:hypothetical protein
MQREEKEEDDSERFFRTFGWVVWRSSSNRTTESSTSGRIFSGVESYATSFGAIHTRTLAIIPAKPPHTMRRVTSDVAAAAVDVVLLLPALAPGSAAAMGSRQTVLSSSLSCLRSQWQRNKIA